MRESGILLPMASLPSSWGIGSLGEEALLFADFLAAAGQSVWQVLPLTVPDFVHSPYASPSAFAGNPMLIDPASLAEDGLITAAEADPPAGAMADRVDYAFAAREKDRCLRRAYLSFRESPSAEFDRFREREAHWLSGYALFAAIKGYYGGRPWWLWDDGIRMRRAEDIRRFREELAEEIGFTEFCQYIFDRQLGKLRDRLGERGITLMGDIPFYVAHDSADVWENPSLFALREDGSVRLAAGVPPDFFSARGQLWGNPVYDWDRMAADGFDFWMRRLARCGEMYGALRLDHFRAFDSYYVIAGGAPDAAAGEWREGPGRRFIDEVRRRMPGLILIAEDLGELTPGVHALRRYAGIPGMRVMQFAFGGGADDPFLPHNYDRNTAVYLGTHDNDTAAGWWDSLGTAERSRAAAYLGIGRRASARNAVRAMMRMASASAADRVIFTLADVGAAGSDARINTPGVGQGCWQYRAMVGFASERDAEFLREITEIYGRKRRNERD